MTATTRRCGTGDDRWRNADQHLLNFPQTGQQEQEQERELATRAVNRFAGQHAGEDLAILGLVESPTPPTAEPTPDEKRCTRCGDIKPRTGFYRRASSRDGLYSQCKPCHNAHKHVGASV